jgi:hypothetical protein
MPTTITPRLPTPALRRRVATLRHVLTALWEETERDGGAPFATIGRAKVELVALERQLREREHGERLSAFCRDLLDAPLQVQLASVRELPPAS